MVIFNDMERVKSGGDPSTSVALQQLAAAPVAAPAAPKLPIDALQRLPELADG